MAADVCLATEVTYSDSAHGYHFNNHMLMTSSSQQHVYGLAVKLTNTLAPRVSEIAARLEYHAAL